MATVLPLVDHRLAAVYAVAFGLSAGAVFFNPAAACILPAIVAERELVLANSGLWSAAVVSQIALAPAGGALVAALLRTASLRCVAAQSCQFWAFVVHGLGFCSLPVTGLLGEGHLSARREASA